MELVNIWLEKPFGLEEYDKLISELKRHGMKIIGTMKEVKAKELKKLKSAGCDIILPRSSLVKNIPKLLGELIS